MEIPIDRAKWWNSMHSSSYCLCNVDNSPLTMQWISPNLYLTGIFVKQGITWSAVIIDLVVSSGPNPSLLTPRGRKKTLLTVFSNAFSSMNSLSYLNQIPFKFVGMSPTDISSSPPSAAYMIQWTTCRSSLIRVTAYSLFGAKPLPESMLVYCHLE